MDAKEYLEQIEDIDTKIANKSIEVAQWKLIAKQTTACMDGSERVQSSGSQQKMANAVTIYTSIEEEISELVKQRDDIAKTIEQLTTKEYNVLHKKYFQGMSYRAIAEESNKSYSWATSTHNDAIEHLQGILDKKCTLL